MGCKHAMDLIGGHEVNIGNEVHHYNNFSQLFQHNLEKVVIKNIEIIGSKVWRI